MGGEARSVNNSHGLEGALQTSPAEKWAKFHKQPEFGEDIDSVVKMLVDPNPFRACREYLRVFRTYPEITAKSRILDAGCYTGKLAFSAAIALGCPVTLLDFSEQALDFATMVYHRLVQMGHRLRVNFLQANVEALPFENSFDVVCNEGVIEHWLTHEGQLHVIKQMVAATRPGGLVLIWIPNAHHCFYRLTVGIPDEAPPNPMQLHYLMTEAGLERVKVFGHRAYRSPCAYYPSLDKLAFLGLPIWALERCLPGPLREKFSLKYGYQLVASGLKPRSSY